MEKIVFLNETKKTAGVRNEIYTINNKNTQVKKEVPQTGPITSTEQKEGIWRKVSSACCRTKPATISMVRAVTQKFNYTGRNKKKLD